MRLLAVLMAALFCAASHPAWAWSETQPGDAEWPEIPGRIGMKAFLDTWTPQCNHGAFIENGDMTVHEGGRISYRTRKPYLTARYRVIEETPHYVVTLVQEPPSKDGTFDLRFWAFRPLGESFRPRGSTDMNPIAINECRVYGDVARKQAIWNFSDAELAEFWKTNKFCHPSLTEKARIDPFWGGDWGQACYYAR